MERLLPQMQDRGDHAEMSTYRLNVYEAINQVSLAMSRDGITKGRKNEQQGYAFRGIDDMYNALSIPLASVGLCIIPRFRNREVTERITAKGGTLFYVTIEGEFDLVGPDGSKHTALAFGEAMDSGDKATNKAMSAAFKYMCMQLFCIPTEGDNDADATTHELQARADAVAQRRIADLTASKQERTAELSKILNATPAPITEEEKTWARNEISKETIIELADQLNGPPERRMEMACSMVDNSTMEAPPVKKPARKATPKNEMTEAAKVKWRQAKMQLRAVTGDDKEYYRILSPFKHCTEITDKSDAANIWRLLQAALAPPSPPATPAKASDTALLLELSVYQKRFGDEEFSRILGLNGFTSVDDFMVNANGLQTDTLLWDLKDRSRPQ
jgi:hypothetical protein